MNNITRVCGWRREQWNRERKRQTTARNLRVSKYITTEHTYTHISHARALILCHTADTHRHTNSRTREKEMYYWSWECCCWAFFGVLFSHRAVYAGREETPAADCSSIPWPRSTCRSDSRSRWSAYWPRVAPPAWQPGQPRWSPEFDETIFSIYILIQSKMLISRRRHSHGDKAAETQKPAAAAAVQVNTEMGSGGSLIVSKKVTRVVSRQKAAHGARCSESIACAQVRVDSLQQITRLDVLRNYNYGSYAGDTERETLISGTITWSARGVISKILI